MDGDWSIDDRAAARAFLQRCEVRLSTLHRVATALLSGAGLMVLLPAMMKDQIAGVAGALLTVDPTFPHVLLALVAAIVLTLPLLVFFVLLGDLTRFYFHAQHVDGQSGTLFVPRFTLTGLRMPIDDLSPSAADAVATSRADRSALELVVPPNQAGRRRIDRRLSAYGLVASDAELTDVDRADGLFELVASRPRTLADEVTKVEFGMTRHLLRLQVIVMRYVKSLLVFVVTALAVFGAAAVVARDDRVGAGGQLWLAAIFALWAPLMVLAVSSPVRWVEGLLRAEGATVNPIAGDQEFTRFERIAIVIGGIVLALAAAVLVVRVVDGSNALESAFATIVLIVAGVAFAVAASRSVAGPLPTMATTRHRPS